MQASIKPFAIGEVAVRQIDGLFSLNDLHRASGGQAKHEPNQFTRLDQTQALIAEIKSADSRICIETRRGNNGGTYACRELVIAYAAWISAAFHLKVIRVFLDVAAPAQPATITPAQQQHLKELVDLVAESGKQTHAETWARLHRKFGVPRYQSLPAAQFDNACQYLKSKIDQPAIATLIQKHLPAQIPAQPPSLKQCFDILASQGEKDGGKIWLEVMRRVKKKWAQQDAAALDFTNGPAMQAAHEAACQYIDDVRNGQQTRWDLPAKVLQGMVFDALMGHRFLVSFGYGQGLNLKPVPAAARVLDPQDWASAIESGDIRLPLPQLARLASVCTQSMACELQRRPPPLNHSRNSTAES